MNLCGKARHGFYKGKELARPGLQLWSSRSSEAVPLGRMGPLAACLIVRVLITRNFLSLARTELISSRYSNPHSNVAEHRVAVLWK
jgi:hypothetical protein